MLHCVGYVRPLVLEQSNSSSDSDSSNFIAHCQNSGPWAMFFPPKKRLQSYKDAPAGKIFEILRVRNRFALEKGDLHWSGGFRDLAFKVKVGFQVLTVVAVFHTLAESFPPSIAALAGLFVWHPAICAYVWPAACTPLLYYFCRIWASCMSFALRCRNRWDQPYVKTLVCELQIHHQVIGDQVFDMNSHAAFLSTRACFPPMFWHSI